MDLIGGHFMSLAAHYKRQRLLATIKLASVVPLLKNDLKSVD